MRGQSRLVLSFGREWVLTHVLCNALLTTHVLLCNRAAHP